MTAKEKEKEKIDKLERLIEIVKKLRSEKGCPWDRKQTEETLKPYIIEEAYEVVEAIGSGDTKEIMEELGDLLLQVVFLSDIYADKKEFSIDDVIETVNKKLIRRHPHVFDKNFSLKEGECLEDAILRNWERIKGEEKKEKMKNKTDVHKKPSVYISETMPSLHRAYMVQEKAKRQGLDFADAEEALKKLYEEIEEFKDELGNKNIADKNKMTEEYGDILFSIVNIGRLLDIHPCSALNKSTDKFIKRFGYIEEKTSKPLTQLSHKELDELWELVKAKNI